MPRNFLLFALKVPNRVFVFFFFFLEEQVLRDSQDFYSGRKSPKAGIPRGEIFFREMSELRCAYVFTVLQVLTTAAVVPFRRNAVLRFTFMSI